MSRETSAAKAKIFGMDLGADPKVIVLVLLVVAGAIYYFTSSSGTPEGSASGTPAAVNTALPSRPAAPRLRAGAARRNTARNDHGPLRLVPVDGSRGDVDPTLRLGLLERLQSVPPAEGSRNLFEVGPAAAVAHDLPAVPANAPKMIPADKPALAEAPPPVAPPFSIPLKYYGFVKPTGRQADESRGLFMDGDNILVGAEGDVLEKHFLIVTLSANTARLEDTNAKQGQDLQVTEAAPSQ